MEYFDEIQCFRILIGHLLMEWIQRRTDRRKKGHLALRKCLQCHNNENIWVWAGLATVTEKTGVEVIWWHDQENLGSQLSIKSTYR